MHREISESIKMAFEIALIAMVIAVIAAFGYLAHMGEVIIDRDKMAKTYMEAASELYYYNDKIVKGSDVVDCIVTYPRTYKFEIVIGDTTYRFDHATEIASDEGLNLWSIEYISTIITSSDMNNSFTSKFIKNETGDVIEGIRFEME